MVAVLIRIVSPTYVDINVGAEAKIEKETEDTMDLDVMEIEIGIVGEALNHNPFCDKSMLWW